MTPQWLTHWDRAAHICVSKLTIIDSDYGLSPGRHQDIIWTNTGILLIGSLATIFCEILCEIHCPACRTSLIATRFWVVMIYPIIKCLTQLEFSFILLDLCLFITIFNFILNYVPTATFWIFTYHKIWILLIIFCFIWNYLIIYFITCLEVF